MRPELTGCIRLPTGTVKLELTPATQALIWRCHFSPLAFVSVSLSLPPSLFLFLSHGTSSFYCSFCFLVKQRTTVEKKGWEKC